jgi:hypothetical protein
MPERANAGAVPRALASRHRSRAANGKLGRSGLGLTVSPDGKTILFTRFVGEGSDLMMIENFH